MAVTHRFAVCLSGAIALGSYEAGVAAQLYEDLRAVTTATHGAVRLVIDVVAGSSAGAVTGFFLAQALATELDPVAFRDSIRNLWVRDLDILTLLSPPWDPAQALFTNRSLAKAEAAAPRVPTTSQPYDPKRVLALWITMTALDGLPFELTFPRPGSSSTPVAFYPMSYLDYSPFFMCGSTIKYVDVPIECLARLEERGEPLCWQGLRCATWEEARESARASASFPVAFRTRTIQRDLRLYPRTWDVLAGSEVRPSPIVPAGTRVPSHARLHFVDGGIFNNEPLGRAIDAASYLRRLDGCRGQDARTYVVIEPEPAHRPTLQELLDARARPADASGWPPATVLPRLLGAYFSDTVYRDFVAASKVNGHLKALEQAAAATGMTQGQLDTVAAAVGLAHKEYITLERIPWEVPPTDQPRLKGAFAGHFGGFLQQDFRAYDFDVGRREAREWLLKWLSLHSAVLGLTGAPETLLPAQVPQPPALQAEPQWRSVAFWRRIQIETRGPARVLVLLERWFGNGASWASLVGGVLLFAVVSILASFGQAHGWHPLTLGAVTGAVVVVARGVVVAARAAARRWVGRIAGPDGPA
jgi:hypothetical protein